MPVPTKKSETPKFNVDDEVIVEIDGKDVKCTVEALGIKDEKTGKKMIRVHNSAESESYDCFPEELKPAKKSAKKEDPEEDEEKPAPKKKKVEEPEEEEDEKPKAKKSGGFFKNTKPAEDFVGGLPIGDWEALIFNGQTDDKGKGFNVFLELVGVNAEESDKVNGVKQRVFYQIFNDKGEFNEQGTSFLKRDLIKVGYEEEDLDSIDDSSMDSLKDDLNLLLKKLRKREPWISIKVGVQKNDPSRTNTYIQGLMDGQEDKPENPLENSDK